MFGRKSVKDEPIVMRESVEVQVDFGTRTVACSTDDPVVRTMSTLTDSIFFVDRETNMDAIPCWDVSVQNSISCVEVGVNPGEWNSTLVCGVDVQTDSPGMGDPLFWFT